MKLARPRRGRSLAGGQPLEALALLREPLSAHLTSPYLTQVELRELLVLVAEAILCLRQQRDPTFMP